MQQSTAEPKGLQLLLPGTDLYHDLIPPHGHCPPCAAGQQVLVTAVDCCLLSAEHSSAQISFLAAVHLVDLIVVYPQIQTKQFLLTIMVRQLQG